MLVVMRMFLEPIREGLMSTFCTVGVVGVAEKGNGGKRSNACFVLLRSLGISQISGGGVELCF